MSGNEKEILHRILDGECSNDYVRLSLSTLAKPLYNHYGKKVISIPCKTVSRERGMASVPHLTARFSSEYVNSR